MQRTDEKRRADRDSEDKDEGLEPVEKTTEKKMKMGKRRRKGKTEKKKKDKSNGKIGTQEKRKQQSKRERTESEIVRFQLFGCSVRITRRWK